MTTGELDPLIHVPTRLKIVATLAALPDGDALSVTRLQDTHGELSGAARDLPDLPMLPALVSFRRGKAGVMPGGETAGSPPAAGGGAAG